MRRSGLILRGGLIPGLGLCVEMGLYLYSGVGLYQRVGFMCRSTCRLILRGGVGKWAYSQGWAR